MRARAERPGFGLPRSRRLPRPRPHLLPPSAAAESRNLRDGISRRPARGSQPAATRTGQRVQRNPEKQSEARGRLADRLGTAPALHDVPALERSHARRPAARWARSCLRPEAPIVPEITLDRAPAAARPAPRLTVRIR